MISDSLLKSAVAGRDGFTWWVGEVESIKDPQKIGRVKVRIVGWYTGHGEVAYKDNSQQPEAENKPSNEDKSGDKEEVVDADFEEVKPDDDKKNAS